jgi:hypothetical protein
MALEWLKNLFRRRSPALDGLSSFVEQHKGVEGYIEPQTATQPVTLLLVDRDGDSARAAVRDGRDAAAFCERSGIPVYDASVVGYPQRMVDFERRGGRAPDDDLDEEIAELERRLSEPGTDSPEP